MAKSKEVADRIGVTAATIRTWTNERGPYVDYVSESARGGRGTRQFTDQDIRVLAAVKAMSDERLTQDEITASLDRMRANDWHDLPPVPSLPDHDNDTPTVSADAAALAVDKARDTLTIQIRALEGDIRRLELALTTEREERRDLQQQLTTSREELGQLRGQLAAVEVTGERERLLYRNVVIAAAVLAAVLLVALLILSLGGGVV